jgi:hypothetical protein
VATSVGAWRRTGAGWGTEEEATGAAMVLGRIRRQRAADRAGSSSTKATAGEVWEASLKGTSGEAVVPPAGDVGEQRRCARVAWVGSGGGVRGQI